MTNGSGNDYTEMVALNGKPLNLDNLAGRVLRPRLKKAGLSWHGWHAFRRGLATNLHRLGVPDKIIQAILRHADISTTMNLYVKTVPADTAAAMRLLEEVCTQYAPNPASLEEAKSVN